MSNENDYVIVTQEVTFGNITSKNIFIEKFRDTSETSLGMGLLKKQSGFLKADIFDIIKPNPNPKNTRNYEIEVSIKWATLLDYQKFEEVYKKKDTDYCMYSMQSLSAGKHNFNYPICLCNIGKEYKVNDLVKHFVARDIKKARQKLLVHNDTLTTNEKLEKIVSDYLLSSNPEKLKLKCYTNYAEIDCKGDVRNLDDLSSRLKDKNITIKFTKLQKVIKCDIFKDSCTIIYVYRRKYDELGSPHDYYYTATTYFKYEEIVGFPCWRALNTNISLPSKTMPNIQSLSMLPSNESMGDDGHSHETGGHGHSHETGGHGHSHGM